MDYAKTQILNQIPNSAEKIACTSCGEMINKKRKAFHDCHQALGSKIKQLACIGDKIHSADIIRFLEKQGFDRTYYNTKHMELIAAPAQVMYLDSLKLIPPRFSKLSTHKKADIFEAIYLMDSDFRIGYLHYTFQIPIEKIDYSFGDNFQPPFSQEEFYNILFNGLV